MRRFAMAAVLLLTLVMLAAGALAEEARVLTPGGPVKMRRTPDDKGRLVVSVPNHAVVEVTEAGDEWCAVTYKKKSGFIRTEFLRLPSDLPGKTVYPDKGTVFLYAEPWSEDGQHAQKSPVIVAAAPCSVPVKVLAVDGIWLRAELNGVEGWATVEAFSWQYEEPAADPDWTARPGMLTEAAAGIGERGDPVVVGCRWQGDKVLVQGTDGIWDFVPCASVALTNPGDAPAEDVSGAVQPPVAWPDAEDAARSALTRKVRSFAKEEGLIPVSVLRTRLPEVGGTVWECCFVSPSGQVRYTALVDAQTGKVVLTADDTGFAEPLKPGALLEPGVVQLSVSSDVLPVGGVVDCTVVAWTDHLCAWKVESEGKTVAASGEESAHFTASWRAREAGTYTLTVTVTDEEKTVGTASAVLTVDPALPAQDGPEEIYSQKDGWWADKAYRDKSLESSGCAIFALAHALHLRGHLGPETDPAALAKKYSLCLTPTGTNNERLIRWAGTDYGFTTQPELVTDRKDIVRGMVLAKPKTIKPHTHFTAQVYVLGTDEGGRHKPFASGYRPQFYFRTTDVTGTITLPEDVAMVMPGDNVKMSVDLIQHIAIEPNLRFAIREGGRTVGAGVVTEVAD